MFVLYFYFFSYPFFFIIMKQGNFIYVKEDHIMEFNEKLNEYINNLSCTAKELCELSGLSAATLSRYRSGERVPEMNSDALWQLCCAIAQLSFLKQNCHLTPDTVKEDLLTSTDISTTDKEHLRINFNTLVSVLNINITRLCQSISYDTSTIFRFRNGTRQPSEPLIFAAAVSQYIASQFNTPEDIDVLAELLKCSKEELSKSTSRSSRLQSWLLEKHTASENSISKFLSELDHGDLNEYIKVIHFDEMKLPPLMPFQFPTSKTYLGLTEMMESEIDFLKATVLSKSTSPVIMYSDMPMGEMAKDPEFPKKWMFGMAMMLKKGLHLHQIHNLDRSFEDMMLGLESWIPMYMTGQISPYYLKDTQNHIFLHLLKVSGAAALSGEAIAGHQENGRYYLTKSKEEILYYRNRAEELLHSASPLMDIYRADNASALQAFLLSDSHTKGKRRNILSALPLYTLHEEALKQFLNRHSLSDQEKEKILSYASSQKQLMERILTNAPVEDEISEIPEESFVQHPPLMPLSGIFMEKDLPYTYEEYRFHLEQTRQYAREHSSYTLTEVKMQTFHNLQIHIHEGEWAMISKANAPAIHFVIHHPRLRQAIEQFIPPVQET